MIRWQDYQDPGPASAQGPGRSGVHWWVSDRRGGRSPAPYDGLNLAHHVGDQPEVVDQNRRVLAEALGLDAGRLRFMDQVHGAEVAVVDSATPPGPQADAMVTVDPTVALMVMVADCAPILLADRTHGAVGVVHAGRPGLSAGVIDAAVDMLVGLGARAGDLEAVIGPSVCARCYEVPEQMYTDVVAAHPAAASVSWTGTPAVDVAAGAVARLRRLGVTRLTWLPGCTREDPALFSYRRDGRTGRFAAGVRVLADQDSRDVPDVPDSQDSAAVQQRSDLQGSW